MSLINDECILKSAIARGLSPDPDLSLSDWADENRILSSKSSSEPGRWRTSRTPYLRKIMDCLSPTTRYEKIIFKASAQIGKTTVGENWLGYIIDKCPAPILIVQPTVDMAKKFSQQRIDTMIESTECLKGKIVEKKSRDSGNTLFLKNFEGGMLMLAGSNSATSLRSMPIRFVYMDEVDAYPDDVDGEGSPIELAGKRTATFSKRKIFMTSTPTVDGLSKIDAAYVQTDQNQYFVPCPECLEFQTIEFDNLRFDRDENQKPILSTVRLKCIHCEALIPEHKKTEMLLAGEWRATCPENIDRKIIGFHINSLYSPLGWYSWQQAIKDYHDADGNVMKMKTFVNTVLGETWKEKGEAPDWRRLYDRREDYKIGVVPMGAVVLTAAADVQKDRIVCEIKGWGRNLRSWSIDYRTILGDPADVDVWRELAMILTEDFQHECGQILRVSKMVVDSGYQTQSVYRFVMNSNPGVVMAVKGSDALQTIISAPKPVTVRVDGRRQRSACRLFMMGSSLVKHEIYSWLKAEKPIESEIEPYGFARFPEYDMEFFKGLASEQLVKKKHHGFDKFYWMKIFERNEPLDLFVMNRVAAYAIGLDRWKSQRWDALESQFKIANKAESVDNDQDKPVKPIIVDQTRPRIKRRDTGGWLR